MDTYNPKINYKRILVRYLKFLYRKGIERPGTLEEFPHLKGHKPMIEFRVDENNELYVTGDIRVHGVKVQPIMNMPYFKPSMNRSYYVMLKDVISGCIQFRTSRNWYSAENRIGLVYGGGFKKISDILRLMSRQYYSDILAFER